MNKKNATKARAAKQDGTKRGYTKRSDKWTQPKKAPHKKAAKKKTTVKINAALVNRIPPIKASIDISKFDWANPESINSRWLNYDIFLKWTQGTGAAAYTITFGQYFRQHSLEFKTVAFGFGPIGPGAEKLLVNFDSSAPHVQKESIEIRMKDGKMTASSKAAAQKLAKCAGEKEPAVPGDDLRAYFLVQEIERKDPAQQIFLVVPLKDTN